MSISSVQPSWNPIVTSASSQPAPSPIVGQSGESGTNTGELRSAFDDFVGQTFFGHLLSAMRKTVDKPAYFHGGRAEEVFQGQLDQMLVERVSQASAPQLTDPMFKLFTLSRT